MRPASAPSLKPNRHKNMHHKKSISNRQKNRSTSRYGRCSKIEPMQTECHCSKPHENAEEERAHHLVQKAAVIQKVIVTDEEAERKRQEDYEIKVYGKLIEKKTEESFKGTVQRK